MRTTLLVILLLALQWSAAGATIRWTGSGESNHWDDPANWDSDVPGAKDTALFENTNTNEPIVIEGLVDLGRIIVRLPRKTDRLTLTGTGTLVLHGAEHLPNKYATARVVTGMLDIGADLHVDIRHQRFTAGNMDGTIVIRSKSWVSGPATSSVFKRILSQPRPSAPEESQGLSGSKPCVLSAGRMEARRPSSVKGRTGICFRPAPSHRQIAVKEHVREDCFAGSDGCRGPRSTRGVELLPSGVRVCNTFHHGVPVAEFALMAMLVLARRVCHYDSRMRQGDWSGAAMWGESLQDRIR